MKIRNTLTGKAVAAAVLLTALVCWGCRNDKLLYKTILEAAAKGDLAEVKKHLEKGADVSAKAANGLTPLGTAVKNGYEDMAALLSKNGAKK